MVKINRYQRNQTTITLQQQDIISKARVLVIGLGGLGSHLIEGLARIGFKHIGVCDYDVIDESNLNRQLLALEENIGQSKTSLAFKRLKQINANLNIEVYDSKYPNDKIDEDFNSYDLIIDCLDNIETRVLLEKQCLINNKRLIYGTIAGNYGYLGVIDHDNMLIAQQMNITNSIEKNLGNPYYIVATLAALQLKLVLQVTLEEQYQRNGFYCIDLNDLSIEFVSVK